MSDLNPRTEVSMHADSLIPCFRLGSAAPAFGACDGFMTGNIDSSVRSCVDVRTLWWEYIFFWFCVDATRKKKLKMDQFTRCCKNAQVSGASGSLGSFSFFSTSRSFSSSNPPVNKVWWDIRMQVWVHAHIEVQTWYWNVRLSLFDAKASWMASQTAWVIASSSKKCTSRLVGWTLTSTDLGLICRLRDSFKRCSILQNETHSYLR